jgi:TonB-dependent receptor
MKSVYILSTSVWLLYSLTGFSQTVIEGHVISRSSRERLSGAFISCYNTNSYNAASAKNQKSVLNAITDNHGVFKLNNLTPGEYEVKIEFIGFASDSQHLSLSQNKKVEIEILLDEQAKELEDVTVFGSINGQNDAGSRITEKRANNIMNVVSARSMERSPDINAATVLRRVSGVTIQKNSGADEAYAIVRGLEARYNNTLINGIKIASPDEKSRFVSLDVVPSDLLQKIEISKTLLPEMEGDAIGGTVNLVMKDAPENKVFTALGSLGYSTLFFDRKFTTFPKGDIQQHTLQDRFGTSYVAQSNDFSRSNLKFNDISAPPTGIFSMAYGRRFLKKKLGFIVAESFQNQYFGTNEAFQSAVPQNSVNAPQIGDQANRYFSSQQLNNGFTVHLDYNFDDRNKIILTNIFLYSYLAQARNIIDTAFIGSSGGRSGPGTGPIFYDNTSLTNHQTIENLKLEGKHTLSRHFQFDWAGVFSYATKRSPDWADLVTDKTIDTVHTTSDIHGPYTFRSSPLYFDDFPRIWQHNEDKDYDVLGNLAYKSKLGGIGTLELKAGGLYRHKTRYNLQDEYNLRPLAYSNGDKQIFVNIDQAQWKVYNTAGTQQYDVNNYQLFEDITAGYGQFKVSMKYLDIFGGIRTEKTHQGYTLNTFYPTGINGITKDYTDLLPSIMLKYKLNSRTNIRASYFRSIARPQYYELVPAPVLSSTSATSAEGNPNLKHTIADNYDVRYEFFPQEEEQVFVGGFYKNIQDPIEYAYIDGSTYMPQNFGNAIVYGAELVYTKYFGNIGITGNYSYVYSRIKSTKTYINAIRGTANDSLQSRPLGGQTDHTLNLSLLYRNERAHSFVQLSYQYLGKTLAQVYSTYGYDYYQQPQSSLSVSAEQGLANKHFTLFGKFNNLLNTATVDKIGALETVRDIYKSSFSIGLRYAN